MLLQNDMNPLGSVFTQPQSNLSPIQGNMNTKIENEESNANQNFNLSNFLVSDEQNLSTLEQAKKGIIEQVLHKMLGGTNSDENSEGKLFPNVQYEMHNYAQQSSSDYSEQSLEKTPYGFLYESSQEYYQKTTIDFSASAMINTPEGQYEIEINFQYTQEVYEKHSSAIAMQQEDLANKPLQVNLDNDDYSLKDLKHIDLVFDAKKAEELEEENEKNQMLMKFLQSLFERKDEEKNQVQNDFFAQVSVYERNDESYQLAAQTQNGVGMYFSHEKSEAAYMQASYDSNGNFSFSAGYSSYESSTFALKV